MENTEKFRRFDVVSDESDHYFLNKYVDGNCFSDSRHVVYKKIMKEWKILEENLPESIYVRVYERHINLLSAMIVGVAGTPYHDGLFYFDIAFPDTYPDTPPKVRFRSFGVKLLNPNFSTNGKLCLSLLNTWEGTESEMWDPSISTILQVLISIQSLVLNENPFFNEIPLIRRMEGKWLREHYNEYAFVATCQYSINLITTPPKNFENFVRAHFRDRGSVILSACKAYINGGVRVGCYSTDIAGSHSPCLSNVSKKFQERLKGVYPKLYQAYLRCGASLDPSLERLELRKMPKTNGIFKRIGTFIKHVFGRKSKK